VPVECISPPSGSPLNPGNRISMSKLQIRKGMGYFVRRPLRGTLRNFVQGVLQEGFVVDERPCDRSFHEQLMVSLLDRQRCRRQGPVVSNKGIHGLDKLN
jgi:hypothetical protein